MCNFFNDINHQKSTNQKYFSKGEPEIVDDNNIIDWLYDLYYEKFTETIIRFVQNIMTNFRSFLLQSLMMLRLFEV